MLFVREAFQLRPECQRLRFVAGSILNATDSATVNLTKCFLDPINNPLHLRVFGSVQILSLAIEKVEMQAGTPLRSPTRKDGTSKVARRILVVQIATVAIPPHREGQKTQKSWCGCDGEVSPLTDACTVFNIHSLSQSKVALPFLLPCRQKRVPEYCDYTLASANLCITTLVSLRYLVSTIIGRYKLDTRIKHCISIRGLPCRVLLSDTWNWGSHTL